MKDISQMEREFEEYERRIQRLKQLERELNSLNIEGLELEENVIKSKIKDPKKVEEIEKEIAALKIKIKEREEWKKTTPGLFDTAQRLANEATKLFEGKDYDKSLGKYQESLRKFVDARSGAEGLKDEGLVKAIGIDIYNVKKSIIACKNAIGISFSEEAKKSFDAGNFERAISTYKNAVAKFEDAFKDAKEIKEYESAERIKGLINGAEENIENCHVAIDKREVESLFGQSKLLHEKAAELAKNGEMFNAKSILRDAEAKINSAFEISTKRKFSDAVNKLNLLLKTIRDEMNIIDEKIARGIGSVDFSADIFKVKMEGEPDIITVKIRRTVYDPIIKDFVSKKKLDYPEVKRWLEAHKPPDYWYILRIDNIGSIVEQWAVELETHIALSVKEAFIDGFERSLPLNKEHIQWKDKYVLRVPKELGIPLPSNGTRRLYFRLNIDCTTALLPRYAISGRVVAKDVIPIPEKDFSYSCELRTLKKVWVKKPKEVEEYVDGKARELYSLDAARAITDALRLYNETNKLVERDYVEENKLRSSIANLRASLENVKAFTGVERPLKLIDESFAVMETASVELAMKRWKDMNLFEVMMTELLKGRG